MWQQLHVIVEADRAESLSDWLGEKGAAAVTMRDAGDDAVLEPGPGQTPLWYATKVTGLFDMDDDLSHLTRFLGSPDDPYAARHVELDVLHDQQWERVCMDRFQAMCFGADLWVNPSWLPSPTETGTVITLDPGLAFGTGTHASTALCLHWLAAHPPLGLRVLDYGCGSGILAIAAAKLGARRVLAVDHDYQALQATEQNARRNDVLDTIQVSEISVLKDLHTVDLVLANILASVLIELQPNIASYLCSGGQLVMSGVLDEQAASVVQAYQDNFLMQRPVCEAGWVRLDGQRR